jgi:rhodanese-related sulfurtransferase
MIMKMLKSPLILLFVLICSQAIAQSTPPQGAKNQPPNVVNAETLKQKQVSGAIIVDVRTEHEVSRGKIPGAVHVTLDNQFLQNMAKYPKNAEIVVYCAVGGRAMGAAAQLKVAGYTNVSAYQGGMEEWRRTGQPVEEQ